MMKGLNIIEASNMPIGTEFKILTINGYEEIGCHVEKAGEFTMLAWNHNEVSIGGTQKLINATFIPIQQPVSFMEAVKSGKHIRVDLTGVKGYGEETIKKLNTYMSLDEMFKILGDYFYSGYIIEIIEKGKWYIKD